MTLPWIIIVLKKRSVSVGTDYTIGFTLWHPPNTRNFFYCAGCPLQALPKCGQENASAEASQSAEHTHTCATSPLHRHGKSCPTRNSPHTFVPSLNYLLRSEPWVTRARIEVSWPRDHWKRVARVLVHHLLPGNALVTCSDSGTTWCH